MVMKRISQRFLVRGLQWLQSRFHVIAIISLVGTLLTTLLLHEIVSSSENTITSTRMKIISTLSHDNGDGEIAKSNNRKQSVDVNKDEIYVEQNTMDICPSYGCPIYPIKYPIIGRYSKTYVDENGKPYAALSQKGLDHVVNQDRGIILLPQSDEDNMWDFSMGIFDGHNKEGHKVAEYLQKYLFKKLEEKLSRQQEMESALKESFIEIDDELDGSIGNDGGSTAAIVLRRGLLIYFASVGDSLCLLFDGEGEIIFQTRYDKAHIEEEHDRIVRMGGKIHTPPQNPQQARSVAYSASNKEIMMLAMSRAIGDWEHLGVVAEPHVDLVQLPSSARRGYVACGSDGMFEARRPQFVARQLAEYGVNRTAHLIDIATPKNRKGYCDDITLIALQIPL